MIARSIATICAIVLVLSLAFFAITSHATHLASALTPRGMTVGMSQGIALVVAGISLILMVSAPSVKPRPKQVVPREPARKSELRRSEQVIPTTPALSPDHATMPEREIAPAPAPILNGLESPVHSFFGLRDVPFPAVPDPRFLFFTERLSGALPFLKPGARPETLTVLTGEAGTGKSTILRHLRQVASSRTVIGLIPGIISPDARIDDWILRAFGVPVVNASPREAVAAFLASQAARGMNVVLLVDEAQTLTPKMLLDLDSSLHSHRDSGFSAVLAGNPILTTHFRAPEVKSALSVSPKIYSMFALSYFETRQYINYRLYRAGAVSEIFSEPAMELIYYFSWGRPGLINMLCDIALFFAAETETKIVSAKTIMDLVEDRVRAGLTAFRPIP